MLVKYLQLIMNNLKEKNATVSWHTPNRVNIKQQFPHILNFFNASSLPEKYFLTPSHPNSMSNSILDEE